MASAEPSTRSKRSRSSRASSTVRRSSASNGCVSARRSSTAPCSARKRVEHPHQDDHQRGEAERAQDRPEHDGQLSRGHVADRTGWPRPAPPPTASSVRREGPSRRSAISRAASSPAPRTVAIAGRSWPVSWAWRRATRPRSRARRLVVAAVGRARRAGSAVAPSPAGRRGGTRSPLPWPRLRRAAVVAVPQVWRHLSQPAGPHVLAGAPDAQRRAVALRRRGQVDDGLGQVELGLGQPHVLHGLRGGDGHERAPSGRPCPRPRWPGSRGAGR